MMTLKRVVCVTLVAAAANLSQDVCGFGVNHRHNIQRSAAHSSSTTAMHAEPTASEKAAELRKKAEEAKRKAEELRKVAEEKAAKAMMAVKEAQSKSSNNGATATPITARPPTPPPVKRVDTPITVAKAASNVGGDDPRDGAIVPINQANIEFTAGVLAGGVALALGATPVFAVVAAAIANYISKKSDLGEVNEFVNGIATASLSTLNWFGRLDSKYLLLGKLSDQLDAQINKLKNSEGESAENIRKIEESLAKTSRQIKQLGEEIDFIEGSKQALGAVGEVIETSVDKAVDANKQYKLTERAANAAKKAVEKAKSQE